MPSEHMDTLLLDSATRALATEGTKYLFGILKNKIHNVFERKKIKFECYDELAEKFNRYLESMVNEYSTIPTIALKNHKVYLEQVYQPLKIISLEFNSYTRSTNAVLLDAYNEEFFKNHPQLLITDNAGMGKSTFLKFLFLSSIKQQIQIPMFIELRKLKSDHSVIDEIYKKINYLSSDFTKEHIIELIKDGDFLFFFDGYDEIPGNDREKVSSDLKQFISYGNKNRFIITSRPHHGLNFSDFEKFEIIRLQKEEAYELIDKYDKVSGYNIHENLVKTINNAKGSFNEFLENPLYVSLLYLTYRNKHELPLTQASFYRQVYDALYSDHDLTKEDGYKRQILSGLSRDELDVFLRQFAFQCIEGSINDFEKDYLLNVIKEVLKDSVLERKIEPSEVFVDIIQNVPLLIKEGSSYKWIHKSFMEYFAANYIAIDPDKVQFLENLWDNQLTYLDDFSNLLTIYADIDKKTFNDIFVKRLLEDFINHVEEEELTENVKILKQLNFQRELLLVKERDSTEVDEIFSKGGLGKEFPDFFTNRYGKWLVNEETYYEFSGIFYPMLDEDIDESLEIFALQGDIKSFYNLEALLNILLSKRYPFVQLDPDYILPTDISEKVDDFNYKFEEGSWNTLHLAHNIPVTGTEAESYILFIARAFLGHVILNYDEAKNYLDKLNANSKKSILGFMKRTEKN
ncbi:NACHT domain-containing protein [Bacillus toyonensis]|uniref:NACHT domain-containing protein n=1 Tax=Bacillus toyonensis TaxID=155322 RepID=UPI00240696D3|nr:NACHT domain-containing protein [Bacillus toyonensis]MDF9450955.1 NACHT domain-containing protein [Bacillus toyonensis]MDG1564750.1 NACHT domain-containing protein [Bacillus toyonensis]